MNNIRKRILVLLILTVTVLISSCEYSSIVSRTYWFNTYNEMKNIIDELEVKEGYSYIFSDLSAKEYIVESNYGFQTTYRTNGGALNQSGDTAPTLTIVYKPSNTDFDAIILYVISQRIDSLGGEINLDYSEENIVPNGVIVDDEVNNLIEETYINGFLYDLYDRFTGNERVWKSSYTIFNTGYEDDYFVAVTFVYSSTTIYADEGFEMDVISDILESTTVFTT